MDTFDEIRAVVRSDVNVSENSSLFPSETIDSAINRAYIRAGGLFPWKQLQNAKKTSTAINQENYDQPTDWYPDSIWRVSVDGKVFGERPDGSPIDFSDYLLWKENNPTSQEKKWSKFEKQFFLFPVPTTVGNKNIIIFGQKVVTELVNPTDKTIFSVSMPEGNDAVALEAVEILKFKGEATQLGGMISQKAQQILTTLFSKGKGARSTYEKVQPFLDVPDFFGNSNMSRLPTGDFN